MKQIKQLHLKSMVLGLVFGVMSVLIMNNFIQSPIRDAYAKDCPTIGEIEDVVVKVVGTCTIEMNEYMGGYINCRERYKKN